MQKVIIDTNVIVSALISNSYPAKILEELVFGLKVTPCLTTEIFEEYLEVLRRDKFRKVSDFVNKAEVVLVKLKEIRIKYN